MGADGKNTSNEYRLMGGVDLKASDYEVDKARFINLRNLDFAQVGALSKRPGSTQSISSGTSGPITSLFEFQKLSGQSYIVAGSDTAMLYLTAGGFTLLSAGWTNGQPTDMLAYADKLWMVNGQKFMSWGGSASVSPISVGLPAQRTLTTYYKTEDGGASFGYVGGASIFRAPFAIGSTFMVRGVYIGYTYLRDDGYEGPADFQSNARNMIANYWPTTSGDDVFSGNLANIALGFTNALPYGASHIKLYVGVDTVSNLAGTMYIGGSAPITAYAGSLGYAVRSGGNFWTMSETLIPNANVARFHLFTTIPIGSLFPAPSNAGVTYWSTTFIPGGSFWAAFDSVATGDAFSAMTFNFFGTYSPKYIEQNQNVMFWSGFSAAPSNVQFSEVGEPEFTQPDYNFEVRTNDGDVITGQKTYNNIVVITKERSFAKIIGSTPEDLALVELSTEYGCLSNKSMVEAQQRLYWLDAQGVLEFNGSTWQIVSTPVEPIFRRMNLSAAREKAVAVNHKRRNQIWFGVPIDGASSNNITVVFDYLVGAWTFFDGYSPASFAYAKGALSTPTVYYGDYSGMVHSFGESLFGDNGQGITCLGVPNWEIDRGQNSTSLWRRFFLDVTPNSSGVTGAISIKVFSNYDASTVRATFTMYQNQFQSRADFGVDAKSASCEFAHYSASLPLTVNGFSWTKRFLRNV